MVTELFTNGTKKVTAEDGKVLSNGGEFAMYPIELYMDINDNTWFEIDENTLPYTELSELDLLREEHQIIGELINE